MALTPASEIRMMCIFVVTSTFNGTASVLRKVEFSHEFPTQNDSQHPRKDNGKMCLIPQQELFHSFPFCFCVSLMISHFGCVAWPHYSVCELHVIVVSKVALPACYTYVTFPASVHYFRASSVKDVTHFLCCL